MASDAERAPSSPLAERLISHDILSMQTEDFQSHRAISTTTTRS
ncbi:hypothetical protein [Rhizobium leguminosarum]|nr:hypothetical protein [Rhizobium leguminosarum]